MSKVNSCLLLSLLILTLTPFTWAVEYSDSCGKEWEWVNPLPQGNNLKDIAWSEEQHKFIAVGEAGVVLSSTDGLNWQTQDSGEAGDLLAVYWNGRQWIAVGNQGIIITSSDGINWQIQKTNISFNLNVVSWNGTLWVAAGMGILTSRDGIHWQEQTSGITNKETLYDIEWNGSQWIGVGANGNLVKSHNGVDWQIQSLEINSDLTAIGWNENYWVVVGKGTILTSIDGRNWERKHTPWSKFLNDVYWNGIQWVVVGGARQYRQTAILSSTDGNKWSLKSKTTQGNIYQDFREHLAAVSWNKHRWVSIGYNGSIITSVDGKSWRQLQSQEKRSLTNLVWDGSRWVAIALNKESGNLTATAEMLYSYDGITWQSQDTNLDEYIFNIERHKVTDLAWNGKQWLAVVGQIYSTSSYNDKQSSFILSSKNGIDWDRQSLGSDGLQAIAYGDSQWIAVGSSGKIMSSNDGLDWQRQNYSKISGSIHRGNLNDITWNGIQWLAVGDRGSILSSHDGISWQDHSTGISDLNAASWNGMQWIIVGYGGFLTSSDGTTWKKYELNGTLYDVFWNGFQWITVGFDNIIIITPDLNFQQSLGIKSSFEAIGWNGQQWLAVGYGGIINSLCYRKNNSDQTRTIILAGGGNIDDPLQDATNENANLAYQTLRQRGISTKSIKYFNPLPQDADGDGVIDTVAGTPTTTLIKSAITEWAADNANEQTPVLIYLIDHGGSNLFYLNKPANDYAQVIKADEFSSWLNKLQEKSKARVTMIYDACHSGSFMDELKQSATQDYDRSLLFSSTPEQVAYFGAKGALSFSHFFWNNIGQGMDVRTAHRSATVAVRAVTQNDGKSYQTTLLDDNGDGQDNYVDGSLARDTYLGVDSNKKVIYPQIVKHQGSTTIDISHNGKLELFARVDLPKEQIERVWAVVIPPDSKTTGSEAITELPVIELNKYNSVNGHYEASSDIFKQSGQYTVSYYAKTTEGVNSRFPIVSLITVTDSGYQALEQKDLHAVIVVGEDASSSLHKAATNNANLAYQTLRNRGVNRDNIYYLNNEAQDADGDGQSDTQSKIVNYNAINSAINQWAQSKVKSTTPLLIYLIGNGEDKEFMVSASDTLSASTLAGWVNDLQNSTKARVTFIYDAPKAGSFMTEMANSDKDYERINLFSTQAEQGAYYGADGQLSFSYFFWSNTARGLDVRRAFLNTRRTLSTATRSLRSNDSYQKALMDDNGDGVWDSHSDGKLAKVTYLGLNAATASTFPVVFAHQGDIAILPERQVELSVKVDLPPDMIQKVWVLINAPGQNVENVSSITNLPRVDLTYNTSNRSFEGTAEGFSEKGEYSLTYYAQSTQGNISEPLSSVIQVNETGELTLSQCASIDSNINLTLPCVVVGNDIYQIDLNLTTHPEQSDGLLWFLNDYSQSTNIRNSECTEVDGQASLLINCIRVFNTDYKIKLNFYPDKQNTQKLQWEFGGMVE